MDYKIDLDIFQGPLELLYQLVKKNEIEISKISLKKITDQYLSYIRQFKQIDLDIASQFMLIATELIELKTIHLLPDKKKEEKNNQKENIVARLKQYEMFKKTADYLKEREQEAAKLFFAQKDYKHKYTKNKKLEIKTNINEFADFYLQALKSRSSSPEIEKNHVNIDYIKEESINVKEKINDIIVCINENQNGVEFKELIKDNDNCLEVIVTLLAVLELIQMQKLVIKQNKAFSNIIVYLANEKVCL